MNRRSWLGVAGAGAFAATDIRGMSLPFGALHKPEGLNATWIQGTAFEAEDAGALTSVRRLGWGAQFSGRPGKFTWFHIAIPTPVIVENVRPRLERVFVFYQTDGSEIRNVHVYDGPRKMHAFDSLHLSGDRSGGLSVSNTWAFATPQFYNYSIGISVGVQFAAGVDSPVSTSILFTSAGADLRFPSGPNISMPANIEKLDTTPDGKP